MSSPRELQHRFFGSTNLAYESTGSPIKEDPCFFTGTNVLSSWKGYIERRPGFPPFEPLPTTFTGDIRRVFTWRRWSGNFYQMFNEVTATQSKVYYYLAGAFSSVQLLFTSSTAEPFDFVVSNNQLFFSNGTDSKKWNGTTLSTWGITAPTVSPTVATFGSGSFGATSGWKYVYAYGNSSTGHISSISPVSATTGSFTNALQVNVTVTQSSDPQVDQIHIYRTTDGGGGVYFEVTGSPITNSSTTFADTTVDINLSSQDAPTASFNDPPPGLKGMVWFANRIWGFQNNKVWYSGWEEINNGVQEESFPSGAAGNFYAFPNEVTGLATVQQALLVFTSQAIYRIQGDSLDTFIRDIFVQKLGARERAAITAVGRLVAWLDVSDAVYVSDGVNVKCISQVVSNDFSGIDHTQASMTFHVEGQYRWLMLLDGGQGRLRVYDADQQQWMPPWTVGGRSIWSGETSIGLYDCFVGHSSKQIGRMNLVQYFDTDGSYFTPTVTTNLFDISGGAKTSISGHIGKLEYVSYERDSQPVSSVSYCTDDDPSQGTYTSLVGKEVDAPVRTKNNTGTVLDKWVWANDATARRICVRFTWPATGNNFRLYSFDIASRSLS